MPIQATIHSVLIASPSDVMKERDIAETALHKWNDKHSLASGHAFIPIRWEKNAVPEFSPPQDAINKQLVDPSDILIAIFGTRLGSPTRNAESGTAEEIDRFKESGRPIFCYFHRGDIPRNSDREELSRLERYQKSIEKIAFVGAFQNAHELELCVLDHFLSFARKNLKINTDKATTPRTNSLKATAIEMLDWLDNDRRRFNAVFESPTTREQKDIVQQLERNYGCIQRSADDTCTTISSSPCRRVLRDIVRFSD